MHETLTSTGSPLRSPGGPRSSRLRRIVRLLALLTGITVVGGAAWYLFLFLVTRTETGTVAIDTSVRSVVVEISSGDIDVEVAGKGEEPELHKKLTKSLRTPDERIDQDGDTLRVSADCGEGMGTCGSDYRLTVPAGTKVKAVTRLGDVTVKGVRNSVEARTRIGGVHLEHVDGERIVTASKTGAITLKNVDFDTAAATSKLGDIRFEDIEAFTRIKAVSKLGDVNLRLPQDAGPYAVTTFTKVGDRTVDVDQDPDSGTTVEARTKIGDVTVRAD
ncbi:DUF4097 family beta strand repeat-containing protein [Streptomyces sp. NPDC059063]|uniref:DUF4097 family beta strand repeat-containing protein n=1 Tax=unclassified Streptomyces TaxID=2593676 RepID=UPI0036A8F05C